MELMFGMDCCAACKCLHCWLICITFDQCLQWRTIRAEKTMSCSSIIYISRFILQNVFLFISAQHFLFIYSPINCYILINNLKSNPSFQSHVCRTVRTQLQIWMLLLYPIFLKISLVVVTLVKNNGANWGTRTEMCPVTFFNNLSNGLVRNRCIRCIWEPLCTQLLQQLCPSNPL